MHVHILCDMALDLPRQEHDKGMCYVIHVLVSVGFTAEIVMVKYHDCTL